MLRSRPDQEKLNKVGAKLLKARRKTLKPIKQADLSKDASAQFGDLMNLVKQNQSMFK